MILDTLENARTYFGAHPKFAKAFEFLARKDLASLPAGRVEIDGAALFALVVQKEGAGQAAAKVEVHRKYLDIQVSIKGNDIIGWAPMSACPCGPEPFDVAKDLGFCSGKPQVWLPNSPGTFCVLYPQDCHAPFAGEGMLHKVIVKVAL